MGRKTKRLLKKLSKEQGPKTEGNPAAMTAAQQEFDAEYAPVQKNSPFQSSVRPDYHNVPFGQTAFSDPTNIYANKGYWIEIKGLSSQELVKFKGMLTEYTDSYTVNWNKEDLIQRNDIIATYKNTMRTISLGWSVPAASLAEAKVNLSNTAALVKMLYGRYESLGSTAGQAALVTPPLIQVKFSNLVQGVDAHGLILVVSALNFSPDLDAGFFDPENQLWPKSFTLSLEGDVLHKEKLGWTSNKKWRGGKEEAFPFVPKGEFTSEFEGSDDDGANAPFRSIQDAMEIDAQTREALRQADEALAESRIANAATEEAMTNVQQEAAEVRKIMGGS